MPTVFRHRAYRFYVYSNEGTPLEAIHVHVRGHDGEAKVWLRPDVRIATRNRELIERTWDDYFS